MLRSFFQRLVASSGVVMAGGRFVQGCCPGMPEPMTAEQAVDPVEPRWKALVAACRANDEACVPLCERIVFGDMTPENAGFLECFIRDRGPRETLVHAEYVIYEECSAGRRPPGLLPAKAREGSPVGVWLAEVARMEAASVPAFVLLARDLIAVGAPAAMVRAAIAAAEDEVRHAQVMTALARRHGVEPGAVELVATAPRGLHALALDNAVEGCVREAFAALCATHQAAAARDAGLRDAFARIAIDETRHAALAFAIDAWIAPRLDAAVRADVARARRAAFEELAAAAMVAPEVADAIGWPTPAGTHALLRGARPLFVG